MRKTKKEDTVLKKRNITLDSQEINQITADSEDDSKNRQASIEDIITNSTSPNPVTKLNAIQAAR